MAWWNRLGPVGLVMVAVGCDMPQLPGEEVGSYAISGTLVENTCGTEALPAADPLEFEAQLRNEDGIGYWVIQPPAIPGRITEDGDFTFRSASVADVQDPEAGMPRLEEPQDFVDPEHFDPQPNEVICRLRIEEEIRGRVVRSTDMDELLGDVDAGGAEHDLQGENEIHVRAMSGTDCGRVVASGGGPFIELPCQVRYEITGMLIGP